ncbi:hypothetical protein J7E93_12385 [Streptomyces sp. ISL-36]|uniref:type II toxin-antitoxin system CcdA family antitoxin n=1 Tax=Streptomyces sp. ISL-36 TaxID=2819182 RepID=UPI001BE52599|nr:type II toxin-antitoxin system CcdA family antitoxin [Streptomyces sp. ISL-36]MBT2440895.1 hypothetical protein [Streptomyces sp. ISL-36]
MAETTRITVTIPTAQVELMKKLTDNVSAYVADAVARQVRHHLREIEFARYEEEHGALTDEDMAAAYARIAEVMNPDDSMERAA